MTGDYLTSCKNAHQCFDGEGLYDCAYLYRTFYPTKDSMDCEAAGGTEKLYECNTVGYNAVNVQFSASCLDQISDILYSTFCFRSSHLFGCVGLVGKKYCVFNKQYAKEEYETLVPKIIEHMQNMKEWGEFFPVQHSLFGYNETTAQEYYPLTQEDGAARGWSWREETDMESYMGPAVEIPDSIDAVTDEITQKILTCEASGKYFKIIPQELAFLRKMHLPLSHRAFDQRHKDRMAARNPRKLWKRECMNCGKDIETTYAPDRPEIVYCEECYQQSLS